jgi:hypothetical protein
MALCPLGRIAGAIMVVWRTIEVLQRYRLRVGASVVVILIRIRRGHWISCWAASVECKASSGRAHSQLYGASQEAMLGWGRQSNERRIKNTSGLEWFGQGRRVPRRAWQCGWVKVGGSGERLYT